MKYSELHRLLRKNKCYPLNKQRHGHPVWYSPITEKEFETSNHEKEEIATGTLRSILRDAGIKK